MNIVKPFSTQDGLAALGYCLTTGLRQISPVDMDIESLGSSSLAPWMTTYLEQVMNAGTDSRRYSNVAVWESDSGKDISN